jgi:hypothetical protein
MKVEWDGKSMNFDGDDWRGRRIKITPNTDEISIEHGPEHVHICLPRPGLTVTMMQALEDQGKTNVRELVNRLDRMRAR